ncbi:hypothetical protein H6F89_30715 [Cyanobacteria bacterium FACHB-63]|nr:hypothetical protein [Cyanobacteria bacterium FACHB-63]
MIGSLLCRVLHLPIELWSSLDMYNCAISEVRIDTNETIRLLSFNDAGHLPYAIRTDNNYSHYYAPVHSHG